MAEETKFRDRKFCAVLYPEDLTHAAAVEKLKSGGYIFAGILHDEDVYEDGEHKGEKKKPHWHLVIKFPNAVWNTALAKELGITPNYLEKCKSLDSALLYLVHYGYEDTKYQYDFQDVFGPLQQKLITLLNDTDPGTRGMTIANIIRDHPGPISYYELLSKAAAAGLYGDLLRMGSFAVGMMRQHNDEFYYSAIDNSRSHYDAEKFRDFLAFTGDKDIQPL